MAGRLAERARDLFMQSGEPAGACGAASMRGRIFLRQGKPEDAQTCFRWARQEAARRGLQGRELTAMTELGALYELAGDLQAAIATHREVLDRQRTRDDNLGIAVAAGNVGRLLPRLAPRGVDGPNPLNEDARALLLEATRRFEVAESVPGMVNAWICLGDLERAAGHLDLAEAAFRQVADKARGGLPLLHAVAELNLGHVLRDRGQISEALAAFAISRQAAQAAGDRQGVARARLATAMSLADDQPLATSEAEFASIEAEFQAIGQPGGVLLAAVNRAALLGRLGRLAEAWALLQAARQQLQGQGDRLGALEVSLAMAELALTMGDEPEARKWLDAVADAQCPPRLRIRRMLLETRLHVRRLELGKAAAVLATLAEQDIASAAERFGIALATCELATLQLDPSVPARLAELQQASALSPREATAVRAAIAADAFWRGDLQTARTLALAAAAEWRERGEPLPCIQALALAWRSQRLCAEPVLHADILAAVEVAKTAGARDTQTGLELLAATVGPPDLEPATLDHRCEPAILSFIAALRASGHEAAALVGVLVAATSKNDMELHRYASDRLAASEAAAPVWWRQAGVVEEGGALE